VYRWERARPDAVIVNTQDWPTAPLVPWKGSIIRELTACKHNIILVVDSLTSVNGRGISQLKRYPEIRPLSTENYQAEDTLNFDRNGELPSQSLSREETHCSTNLKKTEMCRRVKLPDMKCHENSFCISRDTYGPKYGQSCGWQELCRVANALRKRRQQVLYSSNYITSQYRLVQSGKTASGGCSAGQGSSEL
jgi:hypothetical protein